MIYVCILLIVSLLLIDRYMRPIPFVRFIVSGVAVLAGVLHFRAQPKTKRTESDYEAERIFFDDTEHDPINQQSDDLDMQIDGSVNDADSLAQSNDHLRAMLNRTHGGH
jgi:hypothetical protein